MLIISLYGEEDNTQTSNKRVATRSSISYESQRPRDFTSVKSGGMRPGRCSTQTAAARGCEHNHSWTRRAKARASPDVMLQQGSSSSRSLAPARSAALSCASGGIPRYAWRKEETLPILERTSSSATPCSPRRLPNTFMSHAYANGESPVMRARSVVLPLPLGPLRTHLSPSRIVQEKSLKRILLPNDMPTPAISTRGRLAFADAAAGGAMRGEAMSLHEASFVHRCRPDTHRSRPSGRIARDNSVTRRRHSGSRPPHPPTRTTFPDSLSSARASTTRRNSPLESDMNGRRRSGVRSKMPSKTPRRAEYTACSAEWSAPTSNGLISYTERNERMSPTVSPTEE